MKNASLVAGLVACLCLLFVKATFAEVDAPKKFLLTPASYEFIDHGQSHLTLLKFERSFVNIERGTYYRLGICLADFFDWNRTYEGEFGGGFEPVIELGRAISGHSHESLGFFALASLIADRNNPAYFDIGLVFRSGPLMMKAGLFRVDGYNPQVTQFDWPQYHHEIAPRAATYISFGIAPSFRF